MAATYANRLEAKEAIEAAESAVDEILSVELEGFHPELRSIGKWLDFYKNDKSKHEVKEKLFELEHIIVDANLFLRHQVTTYDLDIGVRLGQTFY